MGFLDRVKGFVGVGNVIERAPARVVGDPRIVQPLPISLQLGRIGGGLTPAQVSNIIRLADTGYIFQLVDLANDARQKDAHLQSVLQTREIAIQGLPWQVRPAKKGGRLKDRKQAEFVQDALKNCSGYDNLAGFQDLISHVVGGDYYGHATAETLLVKDGAHIVPSAFSLISQRRFVFNLADGRLMQWDAGGGSPAPYPGIDLQKTYPGKFIQFQPRIVGDVQTREGLVRPLMWAALFRNWTLRDWLSLAELAWKPWRTGTYTKSASTEDIQNLTAALDNMTSAGVAVFPETAKIELHWAENSTKGNSAHKELFDCMGAEMSKAVLGQTETTQASASSGYAQAKVHNEIRKDIRDARARAVAACITRDLVAPLVRMNFGADADIPSFEFLTEDAVDMVAFSTMLVNLNTVRMPVPVSWVRDRLGVPEVEGDEEMLGSSADEDVPIDPATGLPKVPDDAEKPEEDDKKAA